METAITRAVVHVIADMHHNFRENLTIDDMAQAAGFSRFHFTREFTNLTGVSPRRFLRAIRFEEAKRLLSDSRLNVAEISHTVGYSSVGTFSSCFKSCTGITPSAYRRLRSADPLTAAGPRRGRGAPPSPTPLHGHVQAPATDRSGFVFVGLFPAPFPQGHPVRCTVLPRPGAFVLDDVPTGSWHVLARSVTQGTGEGRQAGPTPVVGGFGPITASAGRALEPVVIRLHRANRAALRLCSMTG
ncbi:helix-turn-helix transcriptional regulator [Streptomyces sp. NPDC018000]|uniref:helix-turn-helix transcriptional regulator n=1 Tax=Streptomyces sp. NPDC018000 TaxID=3365028 RepID=UPI0037A038FB